MKIIKELAVILFLILVLLAWGVFNFTLRENISVPEVVQKPLPVPEKYVAGLKVPVFMYHHIGDLPPKPDKIRRDLTVSTANFDAQLKFLSEQGYACISTTQLYEYSLGGLRLNKKPCVITLDDGYSDSFLNGVPVLKKYGMVGSFAVITQYAGTADYAGWNVIDAAQKAGMEIIAHSQHHIDFTALQYTYVQKQQEINGSLKDIEYHLGSAPLTFVYPYGHFDTETRKLVQDAGFKFAFTTRGGLFDPLNDNFSEPRIRVHGAESMLTFKMVFQNYLDGKF